MGTIMMKQEFLETLRRALNGNMAAASVEDNIRYYDSYFSSEAAKGRSEAKIAQELGDPRILARTLIDAAERSGDAYAQEANETQYRTADASARDAYQDTGHEGSGRPQVMRIPGWLVLLLVVLVLMVVTRVVGTLIWVLLPYALPVIAVVYIVRLIQRR